MIQKLHSSGITNKLKVSKITKSQLRSKLFAELSLQNSLVSKEADKSLKRQIVDSLFVDYLKLKGMEFSLSVFVPESGVCKLDKADILRALQIDRPKCILHSRVRYFDLDITK